MSATLAEPPALIVDGPSTFANPSPRNFTSASGCGCELAINTLESGPESRVKISEVKIPVMIAAAIVPLTVIKAIPKGLPQRKILISAGVFRGN